MLYSLISLFLFFQTTATPASLAQEDCEICQEQFNELDLMSLQYSEEEFFKAQEVLECYDEANCPPPINLMITMSTFYLKEEANIPLAEALIVRATQSNPSAREIFSIKIAIGNLYKMKGWYEQAIKHYTSMLTVYTPEYCQYHVEVLKKIVLVYEKQEDYDNQLIYLNRIIENDCNNKDDSEEQIETQ